MSLFIGVDNGVSSEGIGFVPSEGEASYPKVPTFSEQNYTKAKGNITRIDGVKLKELLKEGTDGHTQILVGLERPMVNPARFKATISAIRCLEATLIVLEDLQLPYVYLDSKEWQKVLLPKGTKTAAELKKASLDIGKRLFPTLITKQKDADSLLIAEYLRRKNTATL